jgi:hypothetical protein
VTVTINGRLKSGIPCGNQKALEDINNATLLKGCSFSRANGELLDPDCHKVGACPKGVELDREATFQSSLFVDGSVAAGRPYEVRGGFQVRIHLGTHAPVKAPECKRFDPKPTLTSFSEVVAAACKKAVSGG